VNAGPIQSEIEAQKVGSQQRTPIIVCLKESDSHPELGVQESEEKVKEFLLGVSYFSSKGPTADGRLKPDLVAPGEKIISCHAHPEQGYEYKDDNMAEGEGFEPPRPIYST